MIRARARLAGTSLDYYRLDALREAGLADPGPLPVTVKILLEGLLRDAEAGRVKEKSVASLASWPAPTEARAGLPFPPRRAVPQQLTGVPALLGLAATRFPAQRA